MYSRTIFLLWQIAAFFLPASAHPGTDSIFHLLVGTYTAGKSEGIYVFAFNANTGVLTHEHTIKGISNPSFLAMAPGSKFVYSVTTGKDQPGGVNAFSFDNKTGQLKLLNQASSGSQGPCYVSVDKYGSTVFVANYGGGSVGVLPVDSDGSLKPLAQHIAQTGSSIIKERQDKPHVHSVVLTPDNDFMLSPDLGTDKMMIYKFRRQAVKPLVPARIPYYQAEPGSGPRHLAFHPNGKFIYLIQELNGTISTISYSKGVLKNLQTISMLAEGFKGEIRAADIHVSPDGRFLYGSNRGDANDIVIFSIDSKDGQLKLVGRQSSLGVSPRNFVIDPTGNYLLVANEKSDDIFVFKRDKKTGLLSQNGERTEVGSPVCLVMTAKVQ